MAEEWLFSLDDGNICGLYFHFPFSVFAKFYNANISFHEKDVVKKQFKQKNFVLSDLGLWLQTIYPKGKNQIYS